MAYADCPDLVITHKHYLDIISWAEHDPTAKITPVVPCSMNKGTLEAHSNRANLPARIYNDDAIMLALSRCHMELVLAALIKAIFVIMGKPYTTVRQCPLAMDKWLELVVAPKQRTLGLRIDTNSLTVGILPVYIAEVLDLINTTWHSHCRWFAVGEAQNLTGKLGHLAEGTHWVFHLLMHLYASIAYALTENKHHLQTRLPSSAISVIPSKLVLFLVQQRTK